MIDLNPKYLERVQHILAEHVPECEVRAYGSRVTWTAKDYSDLDLAVVGSEPFNLRRMRQLKEAFEESDLPIRVDVVDWHTLSDGFKKKITEEYEVIKEGESAGEDRYCGKNLEIPDSTDNHYVTFEKLFDKPLRNGLTRPRAVRGSGTKMINMGELFAHSRIGNIPMERVPLSRVEAEKYLLRKGDLLFARQSLVLSGAGKCSIFLGASEPITFEGHLIRARLNSTIADPVFYYYFFNSYAGRQIIESIVEQVAAAGIRGSDLAKLSVPYFPLQKQHCISQILEMLDDKIELNRQMNETLEAMARAIFKSWFVDFDPVRAKEEGREPVGMDAETAALLPSAFQDSPLGEIPAGWEVTQVKKQVARIQYGFTQSASNEPVGPKFLRITDIANGMLDWGSVPFCYISEKHYDKYKLQDGDILVARTGATTGANIYIVDPPDAVFASYLVRIQFANLSLARLVSEFMRSSIYDDYVAGCIGGSAQPNASAQLLTAVEFAFPPMEVVERFYETVHPLDKRHAANNRQSQTLAEIRDVLLPQLLSGEIRVNRTETGQHD